MLAAKRDLLGSVVRLVRMGRRLGGRRGLSGLCRTRVIVVVVTAGSRRLDIANILSLLISLLVMLFKLVHNDAVCALGALDRHSTLTLLEGGSPVTADSSAGKVYGSGWRGVRWRRRTMIPFSCQYLLRMERSLNRRR